MFAKNAKWFFKEINSGRFDVIVETFPPTRAIQQLKQELKKKKKKEE